MSVPRAIVQSRFALSRGFASRRATGSILRLARAAAPQRQFTSGPRAQEEAAQMPATGPEVPLAATRSGVAKDTAHGIAITRLQRETAPADIHRLLDGIGVDM